MHVGNEKIYAHKSDLILRVIKNTAAAQTTYTVIFFGIFEQKLKARKHIYNIEICLVHSSIKES